VVVPNRVVVYKQLRNYYIDPKVQKMYNIYIDEKESDMTDNDFFKLDQELWFTEYMESELSKNIGDTNIQIENFFLDVPF
jgi:hypothetical protein